MPLTIKQLIEIENILQWALLRTKTNAMYDRILYSRNLTNIEINQNSNRNEQQAKKEENK